VFRLDSCRNRVYLGVCTRGLLRYILVIFDYVQGIFCFPISIQILFELQSLENE
jgi:hypothetical protein